MAIPRETTWQAVEPAELRWRRWEGQAVIFHVASGDTHLLSPAAARILQDLAAGPETVDRLVHCFAAAMDTPPDPQVFDAVDRVLASLSDLGLVRQVRP